MRIASPIPALTFTILIAGASRGLGLALAAEFLARDWHVTHLPPLYFLAQGVNYSLMDRAAKIAR